MAQEIPSQNAALLKSSRFIHGLEVEHCGVDPFPRVGSYRQFRQQRSFHIFSDSGSTKNAHVTFLDESAELLEFRHLLGQDCHGRARIDNKVQRLLNPFDENFAT